jgi:hypothetical protein
MSIAPISGAGSAQSLTAASSTRKPESNEARGVQDHDGDSDKASASSASAGASALSQGRVNVKA